MYLSSLWIFTITTVIYRMKSIQQKCDPKSQEVQCPEHSFCGSTNYCQCEQEYILDCSVKAFIINEKQQDYSMKGGEEYLFKLIPPEAEEYEFYSLKFCVNNQQSILQYKLEMYLDSGDQNRLQQCDLYQIKLFHSKKCFEYYQKYGNPLKNQKNGLRKQIIIKLMIKQLVQVNEEGNQQFRLDRVKQKHRRIKQNSQQHIVTTSIIINSHQKTRFTIDKIMHSVVLFIGFGGITIVIISLISSCILCFKQLAKRQNQRRGQADRIQRNQRIQNQRQALRQKEAEKRKKFLSKHTQSKEARSSDQELLGTECLICLNYYIAGQRYKKTLCNHIFHTQCLDQWVASHDNCPICRRKLAQKMSNNQLDKSIQLEEIQQHSQGSSNQSIESTRQINMGDESLS